MFYSRTSNNRINKIHERSLRVLHLDEASDFNSLLKINNDVTIHQRNIQALMLEVFKIKYGLAPPIMDSMLVERRNIYNLRNFQKFETEKKRTVNYGLESFSYRSPQLWMALPKELNDIKVLTLFKKTCSNCPCRLCRFFVPSMGYL